MLALETLFLLLGFLIQSQCEGFCPVILYLVLSCSLLSLEELSFSEEEREVEWIWGEGMKGITERSGGTGTCGQDALYERRIYVQQKGKDCTKK